jgi:hypothetical protein
MRLIRRPGVGRGPGILRMRTLVVWIPALTEGNSPWTPHYLSGTIAVAAFGVQQVHERERAHARERMCPLPNLPRRMRKWCGRTDAQKQPPPLSQERESEVDAPTTDQMLSHLPPAESFCSLIEASNTAAANLSRTVVGAGRDLGPSSLRSSPSRSGRPRFPMTKSRRASPLSV